MCVLRIEHPVADFDRWKEAFDSDPVGRERSGVRRYRISRDAADPNFVMIDLEFDSTDQANALLSAMRAVWERVAGTLLTNPHARIAETVETRQY